MKYFSLINQGIEKVASTEIKELFSVKAEIENSVLSFEIDKKEFLEKLGKLQSVRRLLVDLGVYKNLKDALIDSHHIFATSSRKRTITWPTYTPKEAALEIDAKLKESQKISIVFGREDRGLTNEELELANSLIEIPANPEYPVLNLAMSVQVIAYELFQLLDFNEEIEWRDSPLATSDEVQHLITHFINTAESIDVIDKSNPGKIIKRMQRMFTRLQPDKMETNFLRGFLAAITKQTK